MYDLKNYIPEGETRTVQIESKNSHFDTDVFFIFDEQESDTAVYQTTSASLEKMQVDIKLSDGTQIAQENFENYAKKNHN